jgi:type III secretory pathway component EscU
MGGVPLNSNNFFPKMSNEIIQKSGISLWNTALEFHTARIFKAIIGDFYILIIPLAGILIAITIISGVVLWFLIYKGKKLIKKSAV